MQFFADRMDTSILQDHQSLLAVKRLCFSDNQIGNYYGSTESEVYASRQRYGIRPFVKQIDTVSGEWPPQTSYFYLTYHGNEDDVKPRIHQSSFSDRVPIELVSDTKSLSSQHCFFHF